MNNTNSNNNSDSIGIHFSGLEAKERATFDRVLAFNVTHGLKAHICSEVSGANLIIVSEDALSQVEQSAEQIQLVVANQAGCSAGDVQVKRPLLITRVMNALGDAIKLIEEKAPVDNSETSSEKVETPKGTQKSAAKTKETNEDSKQEVKQTGHHALIIDDSASIRKQLELELRDAGITTDFAETGEEALEKAEEGEYDLVFLDIIMPGIDGYETCKRMRATAKYKKTPIIMLSGKTSPLDEVQGVIAGATTYLTKPVKSDMLQETLGRVTKWLDNFSNTENKKDTATV